MSTCHVFASPDSHDPDARACGDEDGGETVVHHAAQRLESGERACERCGLRESEVDASDTIVRPLDDGRWECLGPIT